MQERGLEDDDAASLAAAVLDEEAARQRSQAERDGGVTLPDDLLPGVGDEPMTLRQAFRNGIQLSITAQPLCLRSIRLSAILASPPVW